MIGYVLLGFAVLLAVTNGATWYYTDKRGRDALTTFKATVAAVGQAKEKDNARVRAEAEAAAQAAEQAAKDARLAAARTAVERDKALANLGGVVRDLADARRVLAAGRGSDVTSADTPAPVRGDGPDPGADPARRLEACHLDLTLLTDTLSINAFNHERALIARDACVKTYNQVRSRYNEVTQ
jgi:hypothetical protein